MNIPVFISQKLSPFQCCKQAFNTQKQINLYQTQLVQPLNVKSYSKHQSIQKVAEMNHLYSNSNNSNYKIVVKSTYNQLLKKCQAKHSMFTDAQFILKGNSIGQLKYLEGKKIVWRRISELYDASQFEAFNLKDEQSFSDLRISELKNYTLLPVLMMIMQKPQILKQIFRSNTHEINSFGIYKLILNQKGYQKQIVIDDYVPVYQNSKKHIISSPVGNQIWPLLIQKALAKILGSYSKINDCKPYQIIRILTNAPVVRYELTQNPKQTKYLDNQDSLKKGIQNGFLIYCTSKKYPNNNKIGSQYYYKLESIQDYHNQDSEITLTLNNPWNLVDDVNDKQKTNDFSNFNRKQTAKCIIKLKYSSFVQNFSQFCVCYFKQNFNSDFQGGQMPNRTPQYFNFNIQQKSDVIFSFIRVEKPIRNDGLFQLSQIQNTIRDLVGIKGGWLKLLVCRKNQQNDDAQYEYIDSLTQTEDNTLCMHLKKLIPGDYILYVEGYSEQNQQQHYVFTAFSDKVFTLAKDKIRQKYQYFLEEVFLNHCLSTSVKNKENSAIKNYFIENDEQSWYASNLLYEKGGFGYVIVFLSQKSQNSIKLTLSTEKIQQEGYKLQCKVVKKNYQKLIKPGQADVIVLSLNFSAKKYITKVEFPPKNIKMQII